MRYCFEVRAWADPPRRKTATRDHTCEIEVGSRQLFAHIRDRSVPIYPESQRSNGCGIKKTTVRQLSLKSILENA